MTDRSDRVVRDLLSRASHRVRDVFGESTRRDALRLLGASATGAIASTTTAAADHTPDGGHSVAPSRGDVFDDVQGFDTATLTDTYPAVRARLRTETTANRSLCGTAVVRPLTIEWADTTTVSLVVDGPLHTASLDAQPATARHLADLLGGAANDSLPHATNVEVREASGRVATDRVVDGVQSPEVRLSRQSNRVRLVWRGPLGHRHLRVRPTETAHLADALATAVGHTSSEQRHVTPREDRE